MECTECNGYGAKLVRHPEYGTPSCPEAEMMVDCAECDGTGEVLTECDNCGEMKPDMKRLSSTLAKAANFGKPYEV